LSASGADTSDDEREQCQVCGRGYAVWFAPSDLWNAVMRGGVRANPDEVAFICPTCFCLDAETKGILPTAWCVSQEESGMVAMQAALDAERARNRNLTQRLADQERVIEKRGKEIDRQMRRAEEAEARLANLEAVAKAARRYRALLGSDAGLHEIEDARLALDAALAVLEEPQ
jgi:hypothetical protein